MNSSKKPNARAAIRFYSLLGLSSALFLVGGLGGWAAVTELSGAVVAPGSIVVESHVKKVQHPTGGVVGEILARDGSHVRAGDVVVRLDETIARANLAMVAKSLDELAARQSRLQAERDSLERVSFPSELKERLHEIELASLIQGEIHLFETRRAARAGQQAQLKERISQLQEQIDGLKLQATAKADEIKLIQDELIGVDQLWRKNLVPITRVTALKREETRLRGEHGQLISNVAQAKGRISETSLQIIQIDQDLRSEVSQELREVQAKIAELVERKVSALDQLKRIEIRAPQSGVVHQSVVHTVGGVIGGGEAMMLIVPETDDLSVEVKVSPQDIDQVRPGLRTVLRLTSFSQRSTPELMGTVVLIAADLVTDARSGERYYPVRVALAPGERERLGALRLVPGMPVEGLIQTSSRSALSYLTKPVVDHAVRAFREE
ncbi:HlyD family type I secretion periplasmic adaptor subunit [Microvirga sp. ACRRW]|uniref:HlyD family type I secretion periplasmic adaptor subunit n=1 Tax=Microvirga sp. ACRRW TaxID=2918205 RepID=UPI001EF645F7|nr:HlyD family type I secretion periplasmic adaptor subunit [Microvirga sp. ACRRW]MCG7394809.1 HlyD family type I secretion periplasmic adaptor subunit [Microvirga sp. ACRRW]